MAFELLLERGQRPIAFRGELLDGYVVEDIRVDDLLKIVVCGIDISQHLAFQATISLRDNEIDQLGHLDILGRLVVHTILDRIDVKGIGDIVCHNAAGASAK